ADPGTAPRPGGPCLDPRALPEVTDRIDLAGIEVLAKHGVYPEEKERLQPFIVDVTAHLDLAPAGRSDDLADTLDYGALASEIEKVVASESHQLIERVAQTVAETVLSHEIVDRVEVTIHKPEAPVEGAWRGTSLSIERGRRAEAPAASVRSWATVARTCGPVTPDSPSSARSPPGRPSTRPSRSEGPGRTRA